MRESQALRRARILSRNGRAAEADTFRVTLFRGRLVRGGRSLLGTWGVFDCTSGELLEPKSLPVPTNSGWGGHE
jgi:hypothetical protein